MSAIADFRIIETSKLNQLRDNAEVKIKKNFSVKRWLTTTGTFSIPIQQN
jgi:hypothetical protein